jgi:DNA (cytosine-5)-methyltransferase 1
MRPRLLDLFCGAGGAAMGYHRAGFDVVGVDIRPQPNYPFEFVQWDALEYLRDWRCPPDCISDVFDAIHASPPCQAYSVANNIHQHAHPDLLPATRELLQQTGLPWVIENVPGAPMHQGLPSLFDPERWGVLVCGLHFPDLNVKRHRLFESNFPLEGTPPCPIGHPGDWLLVFGHTVLERSGQIDRNTPSGGPRYRRRHVGTDRGREAMGIDWMNRDELSEAIPPAYTEFIGKQLLDHIYDEAVAKWQAGLYG